MFYQLCFWKKLVSWEMKKKNKATSIPHSNFLSSYTRLKTLSPLKILSCVYSPCYKYSNDVGHFLNKLSFFKYALERKEKMQGQFIIFMAIYTSDWKIVFTSILQHFLRERFLLSRLSCSSSKCRVSNVFHLCTQQGGE